MAGTILWEGDLIEAIIIRTHHRRLKHSLLYYLSDLDAILQPRAVVDSFDHRGLDLELSGQFLQRRGGYDVPFDVCLPVLLHHSIK